MRIYWQYDPNDTGKGKFTKRLIPELEKLGVRIKFRPEHCDATISYTRFRKESGKLPTVLRVDGVHMIRGKKWIARDDFIIKSINKADAVIWQSEFCKKIIKGMYPAKPKKDYVIFNGENITSRAGEKIVSPYPKNVVISAKWQDKRDEKRIHKRLKHHTKVARDYIVWGKYDDVCFWILGNNEDKYYESERLRYVGWLENDEDIKKYLRMADVFLYLPWFDWCPNMAVEAMACGCYLICSNNGGHAELTKGYGTVIETDAEIEPKMVGCKDVPDFNRTKVIEEIDKYFQGVELDRQHQCLSVVEYNPDIDIQNTAKKYKAVFERVI